MVFERHADPEGDAALRQVLAGLAEARHDWRAAQVTHAEYGSHGFPSRTSLGRILSMLGALLFPLRMGPEELTPEREDSFVEATLELALLQLGAQVRMDLVYNQPELSPDALEEQVQSILRAFAAELPRIRRLLDTDVKAAYAGDPAARSVDEILLCYPCITAVIHHRIAHRLYQLGARLVARIISEIAHSRTGIDIHPGAAIGPGFFIDHGTGVVIGETAIIGRDVRIYQAVTLGARNFAVDSDGALIRDAARHPIVEDGVVIYAGATILGRVTIGAGSVIGGNVWLTHGVPPGSYVSQSSVQVDVRPLRVVGQVAEDAA